MDISKNLKTKKTLTIAIPAYNEEKGIAHVLANLKDQNYLGYKLEKIVVYSDGSKDQTVQIVRRMMKRVPKLKLILGKTQKGKVARLNQIYRENKSDFLVVVDGDVGLVGRNFIRNLIDPLISERQAVMSVSHQIPLRPDDFIGRVLHASFMLWDYVRLSVPRRDHVQNFYGAATAYKKFFAKSLRIPANATEERLYVYLCAKRVNGFRYASNAVLLYWAIGTVDDYFKLAERSFGTPQPALEKKFGKDVHAAYFIPRKYKLIGIAKSFIHQPIYTPIAIIAGFWLAKLTRQRGIRSSAIWDITLSTKKPINYAKLA